MNVNINLIISIFNLPFSNYLPGFVRKKLLNNDRNESPCDKCDVDGLLNGTEFSKLWESSFNAR